VTEPTLKWLVSLPIMGIGLGSMALGLSWILSAEPWMLDQAANEILLQTSFEVLLAIPGNENMGVYLNGVYGFFGLWVFSVGLLIVTYVFATGMDTARVRNYIYIALLLILAFTYIMQLTYTPSSYFLWVSHGFLVSIGISYLTSRYLKA